jgi:hypothetical protein
MRSTQPVAVTAIGDALARRSPPRARCSSAVPALTAMGQVLPCLGPQHKLIVKPPETIVWRLQKLRGAKAVCRRSPLLQPPGTSSVVSATFVGESCAGRSKTPRRSMGLSPGRIAAEARHDVARLHQLPPKGLSVSRLRSGTPRRRRMRMENSAGERQKCFAGSD